jgi:hypothetical protein
MILIERVMLLHYTLYQNYPLAFIHTMAKPPFINRVTVAGTSRSAYAGAF